MDYLGEKSFVYLDVEEGETKADVQLNKLNQIFRNLANWDKNIKEYISEELLELANEWREDDMEITKEQFIHRIGWPSIHIYEDGTVEVRFDSDEMFTDHEIVLTINEHGEMKGATIEG